MVKEPNIIVSNLDNVRRNKVIEKSKEKKKDVSSKKARNRILDIFIKEVNNKKLN